MVHTSWWWARTRTSVSNWRMARVMPRTMEPWNYGVHTNAIISNGLSRRSIAAPPQIPIQHLRRLHQPHPHPRLRPASTKGMSIISRVRATRTMCSPWKARHPTISGWWSRRIRNRMHRSGGWHTRRTTHTPYVAYWTKTSSSASTTSCADSYGSANSRARTLNAGRLWGWTTGTTCCYSRKTGIVP